MRFEVNTSRFENLTMSYLSYCESPSREERWTKVIWRSPLFLPKALYLFKNPSCFFIILFIILFMTLFITISLHDSAAVASTSL